MRGRQREVRGRRLNSVAVFEFSEASEEGAGEVGEAAQGGQQA